MTSELFEQWARKLYRIPSGKARNISLLVDNCHAHAEVSNLSKAHIYSPEHDLHAPTDGPGGYQKCQSLIPPTSCTNVY